MSFASDVEKKASRLRRAILRHPFITGVGRGDLAVEKFKFYVRQDYLYLIDYSRVLALASAKAPTLDAQGWFAKILHETLNTEMDLHRRYCARFGISRRQLEATPIAPTTLAYVNFLLAVAHHRTYAELAAALLPCQWGYWEIGRHLSKKGLPSHLPLYQQWIEMYSSPGFKALGNWLRNHTNNIAKSQSPVVVQKMEDSYLTSLQYEYQFWGMAFRLENWPV
jgi:thiaminase/transcriptional activator TenA